MSDDVRQRAQIDPEVEAQQRRAAVRTGLILALIMLLIGAGAFWYLWNWRLAALEGEESVNVLLMGVSGESVEALFVASLNPENDTVSALAVPVDTVLPWSSEAVQVQDAYDAASVNDVRTAVEQLLAVPVHHVVRIDFSGFVELIDLLQGVTVEVVSDVVYRDADGEVVFALEPGLHRLTGEEALLYVRYKGDHLEDETRRAQRQQQLIEAIAREARLKFDWQTVQNTLQLAMTHIDTDLDLATLTRLARFVYELGPDAYHVHVLPGRASETGWVVDQATLETLLGQLFNNPSWETARR